MNEILIFICQMNICTLYDVNTTFIFKTKLKNIAYKKQNYEISLDKITKYRLKICACKNPSCLIPSLLIAVAY